MVFGFGSGWFWLVWSGFGFSGREARKQGLVAAGHFRAFGSDWFWLAFGWFLADRKRAGPDAQQGLEFVIHFRLGWWLNRKARRG